MNGRARDESERYEIGDVVQLKGGGPPMLVIDFLSEGDYARVLWLDLNGVPYTRDLPLKILEKKGGA